MKTNDTTATQQRAICAACFAQQAVTKRGLLVAHGYTRPQHWNANVGTCTGAGHSHFGTEKGRDYTAQIAQELRNGATHTEQTARAVVAGTAPVMTRQRIAVHNRRVYQTVVLDNATQLDRQTYAIHLMRQAELMCEQATELDARVTAWKPVAPVTVTIERKQAVVHLRGGYFGAHTKLCASAAMGARTWGEMTDNVDEVTCERCKVRIARRQQQQQAAAAKGAL